MQQLDELTKLLLTTTQGTLHALGEVKGETRGYAQRLDQRIEDLATRVDERIDRSETEIFERFKRTDLTISGQESRIRALEQRPATPQAEKRPWLTTIATGLKVMPVGQTLAMVGALILALLGILSPGEIKALIVKRLGG
jgi:hypothetical protein